METAERDNRLRAIRLRVEPLETFIASFAASLGKPILYHSGQQHYGFRYLNPGIAHFCLLKGVRAVSALNAMIELAEYGYTQEIGVLIRTLVECTTHIDFVLTGLDLDGNPGANTKAYIEKYFSDFSRNKTSDFQRPRVAQKEVHKVIGSALDASSLKPDLAAEKLLSDVYLTTSNYVHARYPEVMDLYGGEPSQFHLRGMAGTPKDRENLDYIETYFTTVSLALARIAQAFRLWTLLEGNPALKAWYLSEING